MAAKAYIGITGTANVQETEKVCREFSKAGYSMKSPHIPMLGFLVSYRTLNGQTTSNRRYPNVEILRDLLEAVHGQAFTMVHYNSREVATLSDQVAKIFDGVYQDGLCKAIQLNIAWPDIAQVKRIKEQHPDMQIVFQASRRVISEGTPNQIAKKIQNYRDFISYVLIDPSGGKGIPFDFKSSINIHSELREQFPDFTIGFAGGFTAENVAPRLRELIQHIKAEDFCIDAEGGLRDKITPAYGDDLLNIKKASGYLQSAASVLK